MRGLAAAHEMGVLHRDLKPANIMLDGRGQVRITDFGLATLTANNARREVAGTPTYMAPEQLARGETTIQTDLYSLGLVLYELFTGSPCYKAGSIPELMRAHQESWPTHPSVLIADTDPAVERAILWCLEKEPHERPKSTHVVAASLPGRDPLAVALAAGETPSPDMVAAAGGQRGLKRKTATACAIGLAVCLCAILPLARQSQMINRHPPRSTEFLGTEVQRWLEDSLGYAPDKWIRGKWLCCGPIRVPGACAILVPPPQFPSVCCRTEEPRRAFLFSFGRVESHLPSTYEPEEIGVQLDSAGHLLWFRATPRALLQEVAGHGDTQSSPPDWSHWFPEEMIGFRLEQLRDITSVEDGLPTPPDPYDQIRIWHCPGELRRPDSYIVAAAFCGRPTYFEVVPVKREPPSDGHFTDYLQIIMFPAILCLAYMNYRAGRIERRSMVRVVPIIFITAMLLWLLSAQHVAAVAEVEVVSLGIATSLLHAGAIAFWYGAVEPLVRKFWPESLITLTRLVQGRLQDPLVGRDLLVGSTCGATVVLMMNIVTLVPCWMGLEHMSALTGNFFPGTLSGLRGSLAEVLAVLLLGSWICGLCLATVTFLRSLFRRDSLAIAVFAVVIAIGLNLPRFSLPMSHWIPNAVALGLAYGLFGVLIARVSFLAFAIAWATATILVFFPLTTDVSAYSAPATFVALVVVVAPAGFGLATTLGLRPLTVLSRLGNT